MKSPSDLKILNAIYKMYYKDFRDFAYGAENRRPTNEYLPIDCQKIAKKLNVDSYLVYGRLHYHLEEKYGYKRNEDRVYFFSRQMGHDRHCVNFPLLAAVLAGLQEEKSKFQLATWLSTVAIVVSLAALYMGK